MPQEPRLLGQSLDAIADGRLLLEDVLRHALPRSAALRKWLAGALAAAPGERRPLQFRRKPRLSGRELDRILARARRRLGRRAGVAGVSWGVKYSGGLPRRSFSLIVWVREKKREVRANSLLPRQLVSRVRGVTYAFPIDVEELPQLVRHGATQARAGARVRVRVGAATGTLSAVVGDLALISGHVAAARVGPSAAEGRSVTAEVAGFPPFTLGTVKKARDDDSVDGAAVSGVPPDWLALISGDPVPVRELSSADHDFGVTVKLIGGDKATAVTALEVPASFAAQDRTVNGLVRLAGDVSMPGDSGSPVMDWDGRLVGFVVGSAGGSTMVIPARTVIDGVT